MDGAIPPLHPIESSADFQSAVSPSCTRQSVGSEEALLLSLAPQTTSLRYGRLKICATSKVLVLLQANGLLHIGPAVEIRACNDFSDAARAATRNPNFSDALANERTPFWLVTPT